MCFTNMLLVFYDLLINPFVRRRILAASIEKKNKNFRCCTIFLPSAVARFCFNFQPRLTETTFSCSVSAASNIFRAFYGLQISSSHSSSVKHSSVKSVRQTRAAVDRQIHFLLSEFPHVRFLAPLGNSLQYFK